MGIYTHVDFNFPFFTAGTPQESAPDVASRWSILVSEANCRETKHSVMVVSW